MPNSISSLMVEVCIVPPQTWLVEVALANCCMQVEVVVAVVVVVEAT